MIAKDFIEMMRQDVKTETDAQKDQHEAVIAILEELVGNADIDIDAKKTIVGAFEEMRKVAKEKQLNGCYYMSPSEAKEIIAKYFDITVTEEKKEVLGEVNLEDFF